jgi:hypothetical protein
MGSWLSVLTYLVGRLWSSFRQVRDRLDRLQLAEQLQLVNNRLDAHTLRHNTSLRDALAEAIRIIESNPRLHGDNFVEMQRLKRALRDE